PEFYDKLPIYWQKDVAKTVTVPNAFYIPPAYPHIVEKLKLHGVLVEKVTSHDEIVGLQQAVITQYSFASSP
ncbi:peptidase M14, partial [Pseudoalteromonas sp. S3178]